MHRVIEFLTLLKDNNNRQWFNDNKQLYLEAKAEFEQWLEQLLGKISDIEPQLAYLTPKDMIFRIYRDTRFSKDKRPYKENFGAVLAPGGKKSPFAGYYIHIEPGASFVGGGIYCPKTEFLNPVRWHIYENTGRFLDIINSSQFKETFGSISGEKLKNPPRGFPRDFPHIDLLKYKSYVVKADIPDTPGIEQVLDIIRKIKPFNDFLNEAILQSLE